LILNLAWVGFLVVANAGLQAQESGVRDFALADKVDSAVQQQMQQQQLVGVCVAVIQDGKVAYSKGYGYQDRERSIQAGKETMFRWASISKPVTAVAAMQLVQQGKLSLDDDVRKHVPEFPDQGHVIRVRDLMCHQSGIVHYTNGRVIKTQRDYDDVHPYKDVVLALDRFRESPLVHPPGQKYSYSTHAYILLSAVVQRAGEQDFFEQVKQRICEPLGLQTLQPDYQWTEIPNRAVGYRIRSRGNREGRQPVASSNTDVSWKLGGGGFISNIDDMAGFAAGLLGDQLLTAASKREMWTARDLSDGSPTDVGLGFFVRGESVSHNGSQEKTRTRMIFWPKNRIGIVVMSNSEYADVGKVATAIQNVILPE